MSYHNATMSSANLLLIRRETTAPARQSAVKGDNERSPIGRAPAGGTAPALAGRRARAGRGRTGDTTHPPLHARSRPRSHLQRTAAARGGWRDAPTGGVPGPLPRIGGAAPAAVRGGPRSAVARLAAPPPGQGP